ncbi:MAG TPA: hypothetical protein VNK04_01980 [Gemmataceae bacterium]|nr:hypothetical protein [Gemmataceae bacterium]
MLFSSRILKVGGLMALAAAAVLLSIQEVAAQRGGFRGGPIFLPARSSYPKAVTPPLNGVPYPPFQINSAIQGTWVLSGGGAQMPQQGGIQGNQGQLGAQGGGGVGGQGTSLPVWTIVPPGGLGAGGFGGGFGGQFGGGFGGFNIGGGFGGFPGGFGGFSGGFGGFGDIGGFGGFNIGGGFGGFGGFGGIGGGKFGGFNGGSGL